jgi:hypothetical protein
MQYYLFQYLTGNQGTFFQPNNLQYMNALIGVDLSVFHVSLTFYQLT